MIEVPTSYLPKNNLIFRDSFTYFSFLQLDRQGNQPLAEPPPSGGGIGPLDTNLNHVRIMLTISVLYIVNIIGIYQHYHYWQYKNGRFSLQTTLILHRYLVTTILLVKCITGYILNQIENRYYHFDWTDKTFFSTLVDVLGEALSTISYFFIMYLLIQYQIRSITLIRHFVKSVKRLIFSLKELIAAYCAVQRLASFPRPNEQELALNNMCSICLESMNSSIPDENRRVINCIHMFHFRCLKRWARNRQECPTCRTPF